MKKEAVSGLDMAPTLQWYDEQYAILFDKIPHPDHLPSNYRTLGHSHFSLYEA